RCSASQMSCAFSRRSKRALSDDSTPRSVTCISRSRAFFHRPRGREFVIPEPRRVPHLGLFHFVTKLKSSVHPGRSGLLPGLTGAHGLRKLILTLLVGGTVAATVVAGRAFQKRRSAPQVRPDVVRVERRDVGHVVKATGVIKPMIGAEVRVGSRISGVVPNLFVRIGDQVAKGQLLAELDARDLEAREHEAAAALEAERASLEYAQADLRRKRELAAEHLIAQSELDLAEQTF